MDRPRVQKKVFKVGTMTTINATVVLNSPLGAITQEEPMSTPKIYR